MPRELQPTSDSLPELTKAPTPKEEPQSAGGGLLDAILGQSNEKRDNLHPYTQSLTTSDIESCIKVEEATFPPNERCSREKFQYRLANCGELCMGIFTSHEEGSIVTAETSAPVYSGAPERKAALLGHIVATKTTNPTVTDDDMNIPGADASDRTVGHREEGRTICIHSLAVLPEYQNRGLGKTLMLAYIQRLESHGIADRIALIAHEELIPYYEGFGFTSQGKSEAQFGGGGWFDLVRELDTEEEAMEEVEEYVDDV